MVRRLLVVVVFALIAVACNDGSSGDTETSTAGPPPTEAGSTTTTSESPAATGAGSSTTTTRPDLSGLDGLSDDVKAQLEELMVEAQEVRGLSFLSQPTITVVGEAEFEARVLATVAEGAEDFPADEALYQLLGLLSEDEDLETELLNLYGEQVAGFYDPETGEIVVPSQETGLSLLQEATLVHELVHALTDQHFDYGSVYLNLIDEDRFDELSAFQALLEGDATLAQIEWLQTLTQRELGQFLGESLAIDTEALASAPPFLQDSLQFPYDSGLVFVQELHDFGGWEAVNDAYTTLPSLPGSTEQIITPGDYRRDLPLAVAPPAVELPGYDLTYTSVWGEQGFRILLDRVVGGSTSARAADGWGGDVYHQWFDGTNAAFLLVYEGDTSRDVEELESALLDFAIQSVPEEAFVWVDTKDDQLFFIAADVFEVGVVLRSAVGLG